ncbi:MAG: DUF2304 family protein [Mycobacteriaceae bacterium]
MSTIVLPLILSLATLALVLELLRRRRLREKYALIWVLVAVAGVVVALAPGLLTGAARLLGIAVPANLLFVVSLVVLLAISLQLSGEVGQLEEQTRTLAEDVARLNLQVRGLQRATAEPIAPIGSEQRPHEAPPGAEGDVDRPGGGG